MYTCEMQRGLRWRAAGDLTTTSERSREVGAVCRFTVSSAVSPVGPDVSSVSSVVSSVAERERVSPQRARFEGGAVCVAHRLAIVFVVAGGHGYRHR